MKRTMRVVSGWAILAAAAVLVTGTAVLAEPPAAPKVSSLAPAKDIVSQVETYVKELESAVESEDEYKNSESKVAKCSNTLILLALAAGLHDEDNSLKAAAPTIIKAAQELAKAKDYAAAKAGVAAVKTAMGDTTGNASELKWVKLASLPELMKQVPVVNSRLKQNVRGEKLKSKAKVSAGDSATLAIIAQGSIADTSEAKTDENVKKWYGFCIQMRDAAAAVNKAVHAGDKDAAEKAMGALAQSCEDCHALFKPKDTKKEE
jgi:ribosomal protein S20